LELTIVTGGLSTQADRADSAHTAVVEILKEERELLVTPEVAAEFYRLRSYSKNLIVTLA